MGTDVLHAQRSFDLGLLAKFDTLADMLAYQKHPEHLKVSDYMSAVREASVSLDYE